MPSGRHWTTLMRRPKSSRPGVASPGGVVENEQAYINSFGTLAVPFWSLACSLASKPRPSAAGGHCHEARGSA